MTLLKSAPKTWNVGRFETFCSLVSLLGERNVPGISTLALSPAACSQPPGRLRREDLVTQELLPSLKWRDTEQRQLSPHRDTGFAARTF